MVVVTFAIDFSSSNNSMAKEGEGFGFFQIQIQIATNYESTPYMAM